MPSHPRVCGGSPGPNEDADRIDDPPALHRWIASSDRTGNKLPCEDPQNGPEDKGAKDNVWKITAE